MRFNLEKLGMFGNDDKIYERLAEKISSTPLSEPVGEVIVIDDAPILSRSMYATVKFSESLAEMTKPPRNNVAILNQHLIDIRSSGYDPSDNVPFMSEQEYLDKMKENMEVEVIRYDKGKFYTVPIGKTRSDESLPRILDKSVLSKIKYEWKREYEKNLSEIKMLGWK